MVGVLFGLLFLGFWSKLGKGKKERERERERTKGKGIERVCIGGVGSMVWLFASYSYRIDACNGIGYSGD